MKSVLLFITLISCVYLQSVLYTQPDTLDPEGDYYPSYYIHSQSTAYAYSRLAAHSFDVPTNTYWNISAVSYEGPTQTALDLELYYRFFGDDGGVSSENLPDNLIEADYASLFFCTGSANYGYFCGFSLTGSLSLGPGLYWISWAVETNSIVDGIPEREEEERGKIAPYSDQYTYFRVNYPSDNMAFLCGDSICYTPTPTPTPTPSASPSPSPTPTPPPRRAIESEIESERGGGPGDLVPFTNTWYRDDSYEGEATLTLLGRIAGSYTDLGDGDDAASTLDSILYSNLRQIL